MGISCLSSQSYYDPKPSIGKIIKQKVIQVVNTVINVNPDAAEWKIVNHQQVGDHLVVKINYPRCTAFNGDKVCVYKNMIIQDLVCWKILDPHFSQNEKYPSPFARFEPTTDGWIAAVETAEGLNK